jgi:DHA1 family bicyclomycin/chloramphenicol resistance-like MFS transporter
MKRSLSTMSGFALIAAGTVLGGAGTDLVLPAAPSLPFALGGTPAEAQYVLAAYAAGSAAGLVLFGELGARFNSRMILVASLGLFALLSLAAVFAPTLPALIAIRLFQGAASSASAVLAPGIVRALFPEAQAVQMIGLLGSIESRIPALAPIAGAWLLVSFGWRASFYVLATAAFTLTVVMEVAAARLPAVASREAGGGYTALLGNRAFLRYALSQAFALGGLLTFVFGAPAVLIGPMGGALSDFLWLQVSGVAFFIIAANFSGRLAAHYGAERVIVGGTCLASTAALAITAYALRGGNTPSALIPFWILWNIGFGLRGPPGFFKAILASLGDDARASALVILFILVTASIGTALAAPFVASSLTGLAAVAALTEVGAVACLALLKQRGG